MLNKVVLLLCFVAVALGLIAVHEGYKNVNEFYPEYVNKSIEEVRHLLSERFPNIVVKEFEQPTPGEFYYNQIGVVVQNGVVVSPPNYFYSEKVINDWTPYVGKNWRVVMDQLEDQEGLNGVKFVMFFNGTERIIYDSRSGSAPVVFLRVDANETIMHPKMLT